MKTVKLLLIALIAVLSPAIVTSCGKDDDNTFFNEPNTPVSSKISAPELDKYLTTTDYDGVSFRVRFTNGGDVAENMSCKVHWRKYASKPSKTPSARDMNEHESMRQYGSGTKTKTTFDRSHAGFGGGTYIYYH